MITQGCLYLGKTKPVCSMTSDGQFCLTLFAIHSIGYLQKEPYQIIYTGDEARDFWEHHQHELNPGQPIDVSLRDLRAHLGGRCGAQIQAKAMKLKILPRVSHGQQTAPVTP